MAIMNNEEHTFGSTVNKVIAYRILDDFLGLQPIHWEDRLFRIHFVNAFSELDRRLARPAFPRPPPAGVDSIIGTYRNAGYGNLIVRPYSPEDPTLPPGLINDPSFHQFDQNTPTFVAVVSDKLLMTHLLFTHFDQEHFNASAIRWYGGEVIWVAKRSLAIFTREGLGMYGNWWSAGKTVERTPLPSQGCAKETTEVWYEKVA